MTRFFVSGTPDDAEYEVMCVETIAVTPEEAIPMHVCSCRTFERAEEISRMYNFFIQLTQEEKMYEDSDD